MNPLGVALRCTVLGALLASLPGCASSRVVSRLSELPSVIPRGSTVYVTDAAGRETKAKFAGVAHESLMLEVGGSSETLSATTLRTIERYGDPIWNGLAIGVGLGTGVALLSDPQYRPCGNEPTRLCAQADIADRLILVGATGAAGAAIDALRRRRRLVYLASGTKSPTVELRLVPARGRLAVGVFIGFGGTRPEPPSREKKLRRLPAT